jgi:hypothetical protein
MRIPYVFLSGETDLEAGREVKREGISRDRSWEWRLRGVRRELRESVEGKGWEVKASTASLSIPE